MDWLNYHHLYYFWTVAREGSIARATQKLRLAQPTISAQLRALEESMGEKLFHRVGRGLVLTEVGQTVLRFSDEIFGLGRELQETLEGRPTGRPQRLTVGIADVVPKLIAYRLLEPALRQEQPLRIVCREDKPERLLTELAIHGLDLVLSDAPVGEATKVKAFSHLLGECGVSVFGTKALAKVHRRGFPRSLHRAPLLMPTDNTHFRRELDRWLEAEKLRPELVGEIEDAALLGVFGQAGVGLFIAPTVIEREVLEQHGVSLVGRLDSVRARFYAISIERRLKHPAVVAISNSARKELFRA